MRLHARENASGFFNETSTLSVQEFVKPKEALTPIPPRRRPIVHRHPHFSSHALSRAIRLLRCAMREMHGLIAQGTSARRPSVLAFSSYQQGRHDAVDLTLKMNVLAVCAVFVFVGAILLGAF
jgi:hypothetical protein